MSEEFREMLGRIHAGFRRALNKGVLLSEPRMRQLHERLVSFNANEILHKPVAQSRFVVIDTETTGFKAYAGDEICSIALMELQGTEQTGKNYNSLVNPGRPIPAESTAIHGIHDDDVKGAPVIEQILIDIADFIGESVVIGHHIGFDLRFLNRILQKELLCRLKHPWLDTMLLYHAASGRIGHYCLDEVATTMNISLEDRHTAKGDARITASLFKALVERLEAVEIPVQELVDKQFHSEFA
ncbi:3'-5' exonuclease [Kaarinaea lacus]